MPFLAGVIALSMTFQIAPVAIVPKPISAEPREGSFQLTEHTVLVASDDASMSVAHMLQRSLATATGFSFPVARRAASNAIELHIDRRVDFGLDGYTIEVKRERVAIRAGTPAGLFYGCQSLRQLFSPEIFREAKTNVDWKAPAVLITDHARFPWRGAHIDSSRHFMPKEFILKYLDLMALHKLNVFHWHLVDDNGWRLQIARYPRLTEIGSTSDFSAMNPTNATRSINQKPGGFYTQDDIREVVKYAADRFITVVPEIEMPGHSNSAILAYPDLGNRVQIAAAGKDTKFMGTYDNVFNVDDTTIEFIKNVLDEVIELFPSQFIHVGGDEVWKEPWHQNPRAQQRMKDLGLKNEEELQSWFIKQFDDYLVKKGRRLIGWDEILEGGLAPNAAVMSWRGIEGGIAAARAGHDVVMAPNSHTYLDHYQSKLQNLEPKAIGGYLPLQRVYEFEPVPPALNADEAKHVLGGQGQLWSEFIPHPKHMEYMAYPRMCAIAEAVWSRKEDRNWEDFQRRLVPHLDRLRVLDVNFRPLSEDPKPAAQWKAGDTSDQFAVKEWDVSPTVSTAGDLNVLFSYTWGDNRLDIQWVELLENGQLVQRVEHIGRTGTDSRDNLYRLHLDRVKAGSKYVLRASVRSDGGSKSNGDIYIVPAAKSTAKPIDTPSG